MVDRRCVTRVVFIAPQLVVVGSAVDLVVAALARQVVVTRAANEDVVALLFTQDGLDVPLKVDAVTDHDVVARIAVENVVACQAVHVVSIFAGMYHIVTRAGADPIGASACIDELPSSSSSVASKAPRMP